MNKWPDASFLGSLHPSGAQNKTLISNTDIRSEVIRHKRGHFRERFWVSIGRDP